MLRIGEFARLAGLSAKALRNYDLRRIFHPAWVDPGTGYRYYSPAQLPELRRILALKELGIPLTEVAALAGGGGDLSAALARRRRQLEAMQADIVRTLAALDIRIETVDEGPDVVVRSVAAQRVAGLRATVAPGDDVGALFVELETVVGAAGARANLPPGTLTHGRQRGGAVDVEVFVPVTAVVEAGSVTTHVLPPARVAAIIHRGSYDTMGRAREGLDAWLAASTWERSGPSRTLYLQFGAEPHLDLPPAYLVPTAADYVTELQVPVRERSAGSGATATGRR